MFQYVKFVELPVVDQDRALQFYTEKMDLHVARDLPYRDGWRWIELEIPGAQTRIVFGEKDADEEESPQPDLAIVVQDVHAFHQNVQARGVRFEQEPTAAEWAEDETYALFQDTEGNTILISST